MTNNITKMTEHYIKMIDKNYKMTEQYIYIYYGCYILSIRSDVVGGELGHPGREGGRVALLSRAWVGGAVLQAGTCRGSCIALTHAMWANPD
jgi:hypothetical protein